MLPFDPRQSYMMPAHFGARPTGRATGWYRDVLTVVISYRTEAEKLAAYIPAPFRLSEVARLIVLYSMNRQIDWLAGRSYNIIEVMAPVVFEGDHDRLEGYYALVLWENLADPILTGRELQGMPKIFATIPDHAIIDNQWHITANHFGNKIVDLRVSGVRPLSTHQIAEHESATAGKDHWMGYRYLPAVGGYGTTLAEPTVFPIKQHIHSAWRGVGEVEWQKLTWEQNPTQYHIVNSLAALPSFEYDPVLITQGSTNLYPLGAPPRVLR